MMVTGYVRLHIDTLWYHKTFGTIHASIATFYVWDGGVVSALATTTTTSPFSRLHNDTLMILTTLKYSLHRCRQQYIYIIYIYIGVHLSRHTLRHLVRITRLIPLLLVYSYVHSIRIGTTNYANYPI
jgi:hypothetical protein